MTYGNAFKFWFLDAMVADLNHHDMCEDDTNERLSVGQFTIPKGPTKRTQTEHFWGQNQPVFGLQGFQNGTKLGWHA